MKNSEHVSVPRDSPLRCERRVFSGGQCTYKKMEGSKFCLLHTNHTALEKKNEYMYRLKRWGDEIERLGKVPEITSEIGVARLTLQEILSSCEQSDNPSELLLANAYQINTLVNTITTAIEKWDRIKNRAANTLNKTQALTFVGEVLTTIKRYLPQDELTKFNAEIENRLSILFDEKDNPDAPPS